MKLNRLLIATSLAVGFALPLVATAAETESERFKQLDVNRDGVIDRDEAAIDPDVSAVFDEINTSGTGRITVEEFAAWEEVSEEPAAGEPPAPAN